MLGPKTSQQQRHVYLFVSPKTSTLDMGWPLSGTCSCTVLSDSVHVYFAVRGILP